jgi:hypothetical protein
MCLVYCVQANFITTASEIVRRPKETTIQTSKESRRRHKKVKFQPIWPNCLFPPHWMPASSSLSHSLSHGTNLHPTQPTLNISKEKEKAKKILNDSNKSEKEE